MSTTARQVFNLAIALMDEMNENTGATDTTDTKEYKLRTPNILNVLCGELYPYSDTYTLNTDGTRPICPVIETIDSTIGLDDTLCATVLPYGLAAHLLLGENNVMAGFFNQRYEEMREKLKNAPASFESISDAYGTSGYFPYNEFGRW